MNNCSPVKITPFDRSKNNYSVNYKEPKMNLNILCKVAEYRVILSNTSSLQQWIRKSRRKSKFLGRHSTKSSTILCIR